MKKKTCQTIETTEVRKMSVKELLSIFYEAFEHPTSSDLICGAKEVPFEKFKKELDDAFFWLKNQTFEK